MARPLRVLIVDDKADDAERLLRHLRSDGFDPDWQRVDTEPAFIGHLRGECDVVLSKYSLPLFSGRRALELLRKSGWDVPLIMLSDARGEEAAVSAMKLGAADYLLTDRLGRLGAVVAQVVQDSRLRRERHQAAKTLGINHERLDGLWTRISERNRAGTALNESNRRFREMLENLELIALMLDRNGRVTFCNNFLLCLTGWKREEVIGRLWFDQFLPEPAAAMKTLFFDNIESGKIPVHHRNPIKTRTGELRDIIWNNTLLRDGAGNISGTASIGEDVTDRVRSEVALRESETRFRELAENIQVVFWVADPKTPQKLYLSPAYEKIWGRTCQSAYESPHTWLEAIHPEDRARVLTAVQTKQTRGSYDEEYRIIRPDGTQRHIHDRAFPVRDSDGAIKRWVGVAEDITGRKQGEAELRSAEKQLRALVSRLHTVREDEAKRIARELHDDLGQQLTALNMKLAALETNLSEVTPAHREQFRRMHAIVDHTVEVVQKIAGELRLGQLDILGLTAAIDWHLQEFSRRSAMPCRITRLDETVNLSEEQNTAVFRILQEALTNIIRHAAATEVEVGLEVGMDQLTLTIRDNGRGITAGELTDHKAIGLLGMRERAQLVGGDVAITAGARMGTTVVVRIPLNRNNSIPTCALGA